MGKYLIPFFIHSINIGYQASIAVIVILAARIILGRIRVSRRSVCLLWLIPFIRLIFPAHVQTIFSILPQRTEPVSVTITAMEQPVIYTNSEFVNQIVNQSLPAVAPRTEDSGLQFWLLILSIVWLTGFVFFLLYGIGSAVILKRKLRTSVCEYDNIYLSDGIHTAFVMGICKPRIYLPSNIPSNAREYVICHEKAHIKRKDHIVKTIAFVLTCFYWYHLPVWAAYFLANKDMEFACDEAVVKSKSASYRQNYAAALLALSIDTKRAVTIPLAFSEGSPKKRIEFIASYRKPLFLVTVIGGIVILLLAVGLLTDPVSKASNETEGNTENMIAELQSPEEIFDVKVPVVDLAATTGADGVSLYYVDENYIIFGGYFGLFVYSKPENTIVRGLDLKAIGCDATQGDNACEIFVSRDGAAVYLHPMNSDEMYVYSVQENVLRKENYSLDDIPLYTDVNEEGNMASYQKDGEEINCLIQYSDTIGSISWTENHIVHHWSEEFQNETSFEPEDATEIFGILNELEYQPYTCDGLPEYRLTAADGTTYAINFSEKWVWRGNREQAELSDELIAQLKEDPRLVINDTLTVYIEDDAKDKTDPDNLPINWGTPDGPEAAVKNYYADTVFELVSFEIVQASKEHVIFTITSKRDGILVDPNRTIELSYEEGTWKVINEGY